MDEGGYLAATISPVEFGVLVKLKNIVNCSGGNTSDEKEAV